MNQQPLDPHYYLTIAERDLRRFHFRSVIMILVVLAAFCLIFARFYQLQITQHEYYSTRAEDNRIAFLPIVPSRGTITDRNGVVLARNYSAYTLEILPAKVKDLDTLIDQLSEIIEITAKDRRQFKKLLDERKKFSSIPIRTQLTDEEVARFTAQRYRFPNVEISARPFREYPLGKTATHVLGYIGRIDKKDLEWIETEEQIKAKDSQYRCTGDYAEGLISNYRGTDYIGKNGLERQYEFCLHGKTGYEKVEVDNIGRALRSLERTPAISGDNLTLTIDAKLQSFVERAFGERRGALVAIEPSTGGILALVSMPTFDPNLFVEGIRYEDYDLLANDPNKPLLNRAIKGTYPPGSTFKPFMALAGLELKKRRPEQTISDPGYFIFGNNRFRDSKAGGHGTVNMFKSIVVSSDTYYYMLANDLGINNIASFMGPLGFGQKTGIDLPGEVEGVLPSPEWKQRYFRRPEHKKWYAGETISIGIGQGYNSYTMLQLAQATATVANNGVMYRPHLVYRIEHRGSGKETLIEPKSIKTLPYEQKNIDFVKNAMKAVNMYGTGARAFAGAPYESGGKTGTAQVFSLKGTQYSASKIKEELRDHALFIAFAPVDKPVIALAVIVENAGFGARSAAPIARQVIDYYLLGIDPQAAEAEAEAKRTAATAKPAKPAPAPSTKPDTTAKPVAATLPPRPVKKPADAGTGEKSEQTAQPAATPAPRPVKKTADETAAGDKPDQAARPAATPAPRPVKKPADETAAGDKPEQPVSAPQRATKKPDEDKRLVPTTVKPFPSPAEPVPPAS